MTQSEPTLQEPAKRESRIGWWFMRTFRPGEVRVRTARNKALACSYAIANELLTENRVSAAYGHHFVQALESYTATCEAEGR